MKRIARCLVTAAGATLLALTTSVSVAQAAPSPPAATSADQHEASPEALLRARSDCPLEWFCVWNLANFIDGPGKWKDLEADYWQYDHPSCPWEVWGDCASSVYNHGRNCAVTFYNETEGGGAYYWALPKGSYLANLAQDTWSDGTSPDNKIESHAWIC